MDLNFSKGGLPIEFDDIPEAEGFESIEDESSSQSSNHSSSDFWNRNHYVMDVDDQDLRPTYPENFLWAEVIYMFLADLDAACRVLYDEITPLQRDLVLEAFKTQLSGRKYWENRSMRKKLTKEKIKLKREIQILKHELTHTWMQAICGMAQVRYSLVYKVAKKMLSNEMKMKKKLSTGDIKKIISPKKKRGRWREKGKTKI